MAPPEGNPEVGPEVADAALPGSFPGALGIELTEPAYGAAHGRLTVDRRHLHGGGAVHGGRRTQAREVRIRRGDRLVAVVGCTQIVLPPS